MPVYRHFPHPKDFPLFLFQDTFWIQQCLETEKIIFFPDTFEKIIIFKAFSCFSLFPDTFWIQETEKTKSLEKKFQGILSFLLFIDTFWIQKFSETEKPANPLKKS